MNPEALPLRDIHLPGTVAWWPPGPGWWLLLLVLLLIPLIYLLVRRIKAKGRLRREALAELTLIEEQYGRDRDNRHLVRQLSILLRRACLSRFPRRQVAALTGEAWLGFLEQNGEGALFQGVGRLLIAAPYQEGPLEAGDDDMAQLIAQCRSWLTGLTPPKQGVRP